jgi:hypothetical protein
VSAKEERNEIGSIQNDHHDTQSRVLGLTSIRSIRAHVWHSNNYYQYILDQKQAVYLIVAIFQGNSLQLFPKESKRYAYDALTWLISHLSISMLSRCGSEANSQDKSLPFFKEIRSNYFLRNQRDMHMMLSPGLYHACPSACYPGVVLRQTPKTSHCYFSRKFTPTISQGIKEICV